MPIALEYLLADNTYSMLTQKITLKTSYFQTCWVHMGLLHQTATKELPYKTDREVMLLKYFGVFPPNFEEILIKPTSFI